MRRLRYASLLVLLLTGLISVFPAGAQDDAPRVKASQLVKSVVLINTFACDEAPVPGETAPIPFEDQRCDAASWKGSGSVIDQQGHILTNNHVVRPDLYGSNVDPALLGWYLIYQTLDAKELPVALFYARVIRSDPNLDLAVLEPAWGLDGHPLEEGDAAGLPVLPLASESSTVEVEDTLRLLGYPRTHPQITVSTVNVVGFETDSKVEQLGTTAWIRTDVASAGPGNSGGPAVNNAGEQVGVVSAGSRNSLDCQDYNGDGQTDPVAECVTASGGSEYVRPIPEAYDLLLQTEEPPTEPTPTATAEPPAEPTPTPEGPPEPPSDETPTAQPAAPTPEPSPTPESPEPPQNGGTAIVIGTLVSADTGDPIAKGQVVVLKPGVSVKEWKRGEVGNDAIFSYVITDDRGNFQITDPVVRGEKYSIWLQAPGYEELFKDNKTLATDEDPAIVDLGTIKMPVQV